METRLLKHGIAELEKEFERRQDDLDYLKVLHHELTFRSVPRALKLRSRVEAILGIEPEPTRREAPKPLALLESNPAPVPAPEPPALPQPFDPDSFPSHEEPEDSSQGPPPPITDAPEEILAAWTALEALSPQSFRRPEDLAGGDRTAVAWLDRGRLPWEGSGEKARPKTRLYYQVILGTIDLGKATALLLARYTDSRAERPGARGEAALAVVTVDQAGLPVGEPAVSSFAWALPRALRGGLAELAEWRRAEKPLVEKLDEILRRGDEEKELPLDGPMLQAAFGWLAASLGLPADLISPPRFAVRAYTSLRNPEPPEPLLLNSFYLDDLVKARTLFTEGGSTRNLRLYLGQDAPAQRRDLLNDLAALEETVEPRRIPPARWPGPGRHPLVLLQQAAVNLGIEELKDGGVFAVNGPPGTGKTTLLRDIVAAVLVQRAEAMATFDDPSAAFIPSNLKIKAGDAWIHLYRVDARIKGFEMMLASSNNKAVENVSAELPASSAVADDATGLRYFAPLSSTLLDRDSWGLIAAVLGNSANRSRFRNTFWWHKDVGLSTYLAAASGNPQVFEEIDPKTQQVVNRRPPRIVTEADAPRDGTEALRRWQAARAGFRKALAKSRKVLAEAAAVREKARALPELARQETEAARELAAEREAEARHRAAVEVAGSRIREVEEELGPLAERLAELDRLSPSFLARLFRTRRAREWSNARAPILAAHKQAREALSTASRTLSEADIGFRDAVNRREKTEQRWAAVSQRHKAEQSEIDAVRGRIGHGLLDAEFFNLDHAERHKAVPWLDAVQQRARDEVFVAAVQLHKAFLDGSAKRLRHNLGALMMIFSGGSLPAEKRHMTAELWASLFLIVPLVSTTFASVGRMLGSLPPESLGWLLIDEAGQALPQAAVGAILRTRRAVVLGDPLQIEPVVTLPDQLTFAITRRFGVDPDRFNAPGASAQTLADMATPYYADFPSRQGSRSVGVPLLVHRRCADPMFSIANAIAYEHLMVQAKSPADSAIGSVLGLSCWFNVEGEARDKWCPQEGDLVLRLLWKLPEAGGAPSLYIVTPFVAVADGLRKLILESGVLDRWTDKPREWVYERVGTVHTVQGREAEAVIFVLGAPDPQQTGARGWAGGRPNLLNVAVTRAKERLYVVGNHRLWYEAGLFRDLAARLPVRREP